MPQSLKPHFKFIRDLEAKKLPAAEFTHVAHIRAAWFYLNQAGLNQYTWDEARHRCCQAIRNFAISLGATDKYNHTISIAMMQLVSHRLNLIKQADRFNWYLFVDNNTDLIESGLEILLNYYDEAVLFSEPAKTTFIPPDREIKF